MQRSNKIKRRKERVSRSKVGSASEDRHERTDLAATLCCDGAPSQSLQCSLASERHHHETESKEERRPRLFVTENSKNKTARKRFKSQEQEERGKRQDAAIDGPFDSDAK